MARKFGMQHYVFFTGCWVHIQSLMFVSNCSGSIVGNEVSSQAVTPTRHTVIESLVFLYLSCTNWHTSRVFYILTYQM